MAIPPLRPYIILGLIAWPCGVAAYTTALALIWHEGPAMDKVMGLVVSSFPEFAAAYAFIYLPALLWLRRRIPSRHQLWALPIASLPLAVLAAALVWLSVGIPVALFGLRLSTALAPRFFISPEASLYYWFYGVAGIVMSVGIVRLSRGDAAAI
jgi:hypothetical protein